MGLVKWLENDIAGDQDAYRPAGTDSKCWLDGKVAVHDALSCLGNTVTKAAPDRALKAVIILSEFRTHPE
jgi:hypothetical protein